VEPVAAASELSDAWIDGDDAARWRSAPAGSSVLEVDPGRRLPRHTDSVDETIVVLAGSARVVVGEEVSSVGAGELAHVPECVPHEVFNDGDGVLRFLAVYASADDVTTTYEQPVQPGGERERKPLG
jgi:mannose-6-phosphate isomerase-like protein (cupin superfamily)